MDDIRRATATAGTTKDVAKEIEMIFSESGHTTITITAPIMERLKGNDPKLIFPKGLIIHFYNPKGEEQSLITAGYAERYEDRGETLLRQNVIITTQKNETLHTEELTWKEKEDKIMGDKQVVISTGREHLTGLYGFEATQDFSYYKLRGIKDSKVRVKEEALQ